MIHTTSPEMLKFMVNNNLMPTIHRYFKTPEDQLKYVKDILENDFKLVFFSVGRRSEWIDYLLNSGVKHFCVDMAHGDSAVCVDTIKYIRSRVFGQTDIKIIAGNVATKAGYIRLVSAGADYVRVGIAGGCFTGNMMVHTPSGSVQIHSAPMVVSISVVGIHLSAYSLVTIISISLSNRPMSMLKYVIAKARIFKNGHLH